MATSHTIKGRGHQRVSQVHFPLHNLLYSADVKSWSVLSGGPPGAPVHSSGELYPDSGEGTQEPSSPLL
ncbi:hypothetical protein PIB30_099595, partial [Stylosanthes scabra]|nr:hypothetical protein [Stylosanthes scabra]